MSCETFRPAAGFTLQLVGENLLRFLALGPVALDSGARKIELRGMLQRTLLATLLAKRGCVVPTTTLLSELWRDHPPCLAENALHAHVSRLRRRLSDLEGGRGASRLVSLPPGYQLLIDEHDFDATSFLRTLGDIRSQPVMEPVEVSRRLRTALSMWYGPTFGEFLGGPVCQSFAVRCEEGRLAALELLFDSELKIGHHAEIIGELSVVVESEPLNERFCEQLMMALYRSGRQADALVKYRNMRLRMTEELGLEPSPGLQRCERAILRHDPEVDR